MFNSETDICNQALAHLGERRISSLDDDTVSARACHLAYDGCRDELLRSHRWNFAQKRAVLVQLEDPPLFGWEFQYSLPADCLRALEVNGSESGDVVSAPYIIEGRLLLTNAAAVNLVYTRQTTTVSEFDNLFCEALALKIAVKISETIRGTTGKTTELLSQYQQLVAPLARRVDANEGRRRKGLLSQNSYLLGSRRGGPLGSVGAGLGGSGGGGGVGPRGPAGEPGAPGADGADGSPGMVWRGGFSAIANYVEDDVVEHLGSSWIATEDLPASAGKIPALDPEWGLVASVGGNGATGATGPSGPQGDDGLDGPAGANALIAVATNSTTSHTLVLAEQSYYIRLTNASPCAITIPANSTTDFAGTSYPFAQIFMVTSGIPTLAPAGGVTVNDPLGIIAGLAVGNSFCLLNVASDVWDVI